MADGVECVLDYLKLGALKVFRRDGRQHGGVRDAHHREAGAVEEGGEQIIGKEGACVARARYAEGRPLHYVSDEEYRGAHDKIPAVAAESGFGSVGYNAHCNVAEGVDNAVYHAYRARHLGAHALNEIQELLVIEVYRVSGAAESYVGAVEADHRADIFPCIALNADYVLDLIS